MYCRQDQVGENKREVFSPSGRSSILYLPGWQKEWSGLHLSKHKRGLIIFLQQLIYHEPQTKGTIFATACAALQVTSHHFCKTSNQTILKCGNFLGSFVFNLSESVARRRKRMNFICRKHFVWHYWGDERGDVKTRTQSEGPFTPLTAICQTSKTF